MAYNVDSVTDISIAVTGPEGTKVHHFDKTTNSHPDPIVEKALSLHRAGQAATGAVVITVGGN